MEWGSAESFVFFVGCLKGTGGIVWGKFFPRGAQCEKSVELTVRDGVKTKCSLVLFERRSF